MKATAAKTVGRWFVRVVLLALLALIAGAAAVLIVLPRATHGAALSVLTGSMTPLIPVGSVVVDRPADPGTLRIGDIATYQKAPGEAEYITHRIIAINTRTNPATFTFKGDANSAADINPVPATAIRGKVWFHVPYLGAARDSLQAGGSRATVLRLLVVGLALYAAFLIASALRSRRRPERTEFDDGQSLRWEFGPEASGEIDPHFVAALPAGDCVIDDLMSAGPAAPAERRRHAAPAHRLQLNRARSDGA